MLQRSHPKLQDPKGKKESELPGLQTKQNKKKTKALNPKESPTKGKLNHSRKLQI